MKQSRIIYILFILFLISCQKAEKKAIEKKPENISEYIIEIDTSKMYQRINIPYYENDKLIGENEAYISKKKDTFWNTWKFYKNGVIDSSKSKFFDFNITGNKNDSILKGKIAN